MKRFVLLLALTMISMPVLADEAPTRPAITGIAHVVVSGNDVEGLFVFYNSFLGLAVAAPDANCPEGCLSVNGNQRIELARTGSPSRKDNLELVVFETADVEQLQRYLSSRGVVTKVFPESKNGQGGKWIRMVDPDGHSIGFAQRQHPPASVSNEAQVAARLIHAGFVVRDREAEDKFYKDILGFHVYWHGGMKEGEDNWVDMQVPDGNDWLEYMLRVSPDASHKTLGVMNHIALGVPDIHAAQQQLIKNGWKSTEEPKIGRDGKWQLNLYDPDETRVELMEFKPTKEPCCSAYTGPHPGPKP
jgi:catechol 2,3-dioxygenase-like lactoylglutathione lyase family enzyme